METSQGLLGSSMLICGTVSGGGMMGGSRTVGSRVGEKMDSKRISFINFLKYVNF